jgi:hypothetical protein
MESRYYMPHEVVMSTAMSAAGVVVRYVYGTPTDLTATPKHQGNYHQLTYYVAQVWLKVGDSKFSM